VDLNEDEIVKVAQSLLPAARAMAERAHRASVPVEDLMQEAITKVGPWKQRVQRKPPITNLPGYLFTTYKHLLWAYLRRTQQEVNLSESDWNRLPASANPLQIIEAKILIEEIVKRLKEEERFIFNCLAMDYSYREISKMYERQFGTKMEENVLRSKFSKAVKKLAGDISDNPVESR
jgi:RNA polymerase sigma factor (sigma-70 family)